MKQIGLHWRLGAGLLMVMAAIPVIAQQPPAAAPLPPGVRAERDVVYAKAPEQDLLLDVYTPENARPPLPVVVWIHGGAWRGGSKANPPALRLAQPGYAVVSINYRLTKAAPFPAQIHDCKAAIRWVRANAAKYNFDPHHIGVWGASAGGHLGALLGTSGDVSTLEGNLGNNEHSSRVQAVVDFFGPTDLLKMDVQGSRQSHDAADSPESHLVGGPLQQNRDKVTLANPITHVSRDDAPVLIVHGDQDPLVPLGQSRLLNDALRAAGIATKFHIVKNAGHGFNTSGTIDFLVDAFLDQHLKPMSPKQSVHDWIDGNRYAPPGSEYFSFHSKTAKSDVSYLITFPEDYEIALKRYPVVYWLHGLTHTQRTGAKDFAPQYVKAVREGTAPAAIIVSVNGLWHSMYVDSPDGKLPVESVIVKDLIPHIDATYRTIASREGRAIEGYSMGGYGAAHLAFKYPEQFGAVSIMAGALVEADSIASGQSKIFQTMYGGDKERFIAESPQSLVDKNRDRIKGRMHIRLLVGEKDRLQERSKHMHELLDRLGIQHEYALVPGIEHSNVKFYEALGTKGPAFYGKAFEGAARTQAAQRP